MHLASPTLINNQLCSLCWPCCTNHAGLVRYSSLQVSFITVYTVKQTGLTRAGPQKCASVNVVLNFNMIAYNEINIVRACLFVACGCILSLLGCLSFSCYCVCFERCPRLLKWFKQFTLDFAQFLYGPTSITLNDDESLLVIREKKFKNNRRNICYIFLLNLAITSLTLVAASKILITEKSTEQCYENLPCFFYENGSKVDNCSNVNTKFLCFYIDISPLQAIGFIGGFLNVATPLGFKFSTFVYLLLPYYLSAKCRCRCGPCGVRTIKIVLFFTYFILYFGAAAIFGYNVFDFLDHMLKGVVETIIFRNKLGKIRSFNVIDVIAIVTVVSNYPWYVLEKEGETMPQCPCTRRRGYEKCAEQVPINKLSITKIV